MTFLVAGIVLLLIFIMVTLDGIYDVLKDIRKVVWDADVEKQKQALARTWTRVQRETRAQQAQEQANDAALDAHLDEVLGRRKRGQL